MKHHVLKKRLKKRGWLEEDISQAFDTFLAAEEKKHPMMLKLDKTLIWIAFLPARSLPKCRDQSK